MGQGEAHGNQRHGGGHVPQIGHRRHEEAREGDVQHDDEDGGQAGYQPRIHHGFQGDRKSVV